MARNVWGRGWFHFGYMVPRLFAGALVAFVVNIPNHIHPVDSFSQQSDYSRFSLWILMDGLNSHDRFAILPDVSCFMGVSLDFARVGTQASLPVLIDEFAQKVWFRYATILDRWRHVDRST
jgi:hypothetical protein